MMARCEANNVRQTLHIVVIEMSRSDGAVKAGHEETQQPEDVVKTDVPKRNGLSGAPVPCLPAETEDADQSDLNPEGRCPPAAAPILKRRKSRTRRKRSKSGEDGIGCKRRRRKSGKQKDRQQPAVSSSSSKWMDQLRMKISEIANFECAQNESYRAKVKSCMSQQKGCLKILQMRNKMKRDQLAQNNKYYESSFNGFIELVPPEMRTEDINNFYEGELKEVEERFAYDLKELEEEENDIQRQQREALQFQKQKLGWLEGRKTLRKTYWDNMACLLGDEGGSNGPPPEGFNNSDSIPHGLRMIHEFLEMERERVRLLWEQELQQIQVLIDQQGAYFTCNVKKACLYEENLQLLKAKVMAVVEANDCDSPERSKVETFTSQMEECVVRRPFHEAVQQAETEQQLKLESIRHEAKQADGVFQAKLQEVDEKMRKSREKGRIWKTNKSREQLSVIKGSAKE